MPVSCQQQIDSATRKARNCLACPSHQRAPRERIWKIERVMRHYNFHHTVAQATQPFFYNPDLLVIDAAVLDHKAARCVQADNCNLVVAIEWLQVFRDVLAIEVERPTEARKEIVGRDVMVARHHDLRLRQCAEQFPGLGKFSLSRPLREVSGDSNNVRVQAADCGNQLADNLVVRLSEVNVRKMNDSTNGDLLRHQYAQRGWPALIMHRRVHN